MPLYKLIETPNNSMIALWQPNDNFEALVAIANELQINLRTKFYKNNQQHIEYLASRIALKTIDANFEIDEVDEKSAPLLKNNVAQISISHCKKMCAAISNNFKPVGIDVEFVTNRIASISKRFMNNHELKYLPSNSSKNILMQYIIWGCKEALFKKYNSQHLQFRENIFVEFFELNSDGFVFSQIKNDHLFIREKLFYKIFDDVVLVYTN